MRDDDTPSHVGCLCSVSALVAADSGHTTLSTCVLNLRTAIYQPVIFTLAALSFAVQKTHAFCDSAVIQLHKARTQVVKKLNELKINQI